MKSDLDAMVPLSFRLRAFVNEHAIPIGLVVVLNAITALVVLGVTWWMSAWTVKLLVYVACSLALVGCFVFTITGSREVVVRYTVFISYNSSLLWMFSVKYAWLHGEIAVMHENVLSRCQRVSRQLEQLKKYSHLDDFSRYSIEQSYDDKVRLDRVAEQLRELCNLANDCREKSLAFLRQYGQDVATEASRVASVKDAMQRGVILVSQQSPTITHGSARQFHTSLVSMLGVFAGQFTVIGSALDQGDDRIADIVEATAKLRDSLEAVIAAAQFVSE